MSLIISIIKNSELKSIKYKMILIYLLNVIDIIFTLILIKTEMFYEANIIMVNVINNEVLSLFIKMCIPLILLGVVYQRMKAASSKQLYYANFLINYCLVTYWIIDISHIVWSTLYLLVC